MAGREPLTSIGDSVGIQKGRAPSLFGHWHCDFGANHAAGDFEIQRIRPQLTNTFIVESNAGKIWLNRPTQEIGSGEKQLLVAQLQSQQSAELRQCFQLSHLSPSPGLQVLWLRL